MDQELHILEKCTIKTEKLSYCGITVRAKCVKVYDGDTITCVFFLPGFDKPYKFSCRCNGYNSAEIKTSDPDEKAKAIAARDFLSAEILNKIVTLTLGDYDKYGRILVEVSYNGKNINSEMIKNGYGVKYNGKGPKLF
jgi:endonuclease YncB( thermonuclease family)